MRGDTKCRADLLPAVVVEIPVLLRTMPIALRDNGYACWKSGMNKLPESEARHGN